MTLDELKASKEQYLKTIKESGQEMLKKEFQDFFTANPTIEAVGWTQYTPYFNDGDACVFSIHCVYARVKGQSEIPLADTNMSEETEGWTSSYGLEGDAKEAVKKLEAKMESCQDVFEIIFGDGVEVIATSEKFIINDYAHD